MQLFHTPRYATSPTVTCDRVGPMRCAGMQQTLGVEQKSGTVRVGIETKEDKGVGPGIGGGVVAFT